MVAFVKVIRMRPFNAGPSFAGRPELIPLGLVAFLVLIQ